MGRSGAVANITPISSPNPSAEDARATPPCCAPHHRAGSATPASACGSSLLQGIEPMRLAAAAQDPDYSTQVAIAVPCSHARGLALGFLSCPHARPQPPPCRHQDAADAAQQPQTRMHLCIRRQAQRWCPLRRKRANTAALAQDTLTHTQRAAH